MLLAPFVAITSPIIFSKNYTPFSGVLIDFIKCNHRCQVFLPFFYFFYYIFFIYIYKLKILRFVFSFTTRFFTRFIGKKTINYSDYNFFNFNGTFAKTLPKRLYYILNFKSKILIFI
ncbi:MAG TPA: hypothetical protein DHU65_03280 [Clostridiales bacterium]|nr:hypothetical protein [Clostridiales bacterium]